MNRRDAAGGQRSDGEGEGERDGEGDDIEPSAGEFDGGRRFLHRHRLRLRTHRRPAHPHAGPLRPQSQTSTAQLHDVRHFFFIHSTIYRD